MLAHINAGRADGSYENRLLPRVASKQNLRELGIVAA